MYEETEALLFASGHKWQSWKQIQACLIPEPSIGDQCVLNHFFTWLFIQTFINIIIFFIHWRDSGEDEEEKQNLLSLGELFLEQELSGITIPGAGS